jgi:outer membrane receptor protein involved in Fe transport
VAALGIAAAGAYAPLALAADDAADDAERIVVTGSRIQRRDFEANSPIVTVESEQFEAQTSLNVEAYLNQLPQFNPASTPVTTEFDVQITPTNSVGIATVSLRGLGSNRNLVLVDGHRVVPVNMLLQTDVNAIPTALIERSEIITGGASAVYGADAMGGVLNFILKDDFEGLELDTQYGMTEVGDGEEFRINGVIGANFADGRGNVTFGMERYSRSASFERNHDWQLAEWGNPLLGTGDFFNAIHGWASAAGPGGVPTIPAVNAVFADSPAGESGCVVAFNCGSPTSIFGFAATTFQFNPDGSLFVVPNAFGAGTLSQFDFAPIDGVEWAYQVGLQTFGLPNSTFDALGGDGTASGARNFLTLKWNDVETYIAAPQTRYSMFAAGSYDLTDSIEWFGRATFSESKTRTNLFPSPAIGGWEVLIPYNPTTDSPLLPGLNYASQAVVQAALADPTNPLYANPNFIPTGAAGAQHPVPIELAALLNSRPVQNAVWQPNFIPFGWFPDRSTVNTIANYQFETGLRGDLPIRDWNWELYASHGEAATYNIANGNMSLERFRDVMRAPDYGRNAKIEGNQASVRPGFGLDPAQCTSGFYDTMFGGDVAPSTDCFDAINAVLQTRTQIQQDIVEASVEGSVLELPAGEVRAAVGAQYREVQGQFYPDILQSTSSHLDQVIGVYPAGYMDASTAVSEVYGEALVPILSDLPGIQLFELELGVRYSDYDATDETWTYKTLANWDVTDWLRLRGGYNRATRAPNLGELFLAPQMIFSIQAAHGEPCAIRSSAPWGASGTSEDLVITPGESPALGIYAPGQTAQGAANARAICEAQMGPATTNAFYNGNQGAAGQGVGFLWIYQEGNLDVTAETADTYTLGAVITSPFENPWLAGLSGSIDFYSIDISEAINLYSVDYARFLCYGDGIPKDSLISPAEAAARAASPECQRVPRVLGTTPGFAGSVDDITVSYANQTFIETSGYDIAVNWVSQFEDLGIGLPGGLGLNAQLTYLDSYVTGDTVGGIPVEWKGTTGPTAAGTNGGAYDWRLFGSVSYFVDAYNISLRWRHLPEVYGPNVAQQKANFKNNLAIASGVDGLNLVAFTPHTNLPTDAYDVFDLSGGWQINDLVSLRAGVNNLFDEDPPPSGSSRGYPAGTSVAGVCDQFGGDPSAGSAVFGPLGCNLPSSPSLSNPGTAAAGFYDVNGRSYFVGLKLTY